MAYERMYNTIQERTQHCHTSFYTMLMCLERLDVAYCFPNEVRVTIWDYIMDPIRQLRNAFRDDCYIKAHDLGFLDNAYMDVIPPYALCLLLDAVPRIIYIKPHRLHTHVSTYLHERANALIQTRASPGTYQLTDTHNNILCQKLAQQLPTIEAITEFASRLGDAPHHDLMLWANVGDVLVWCYCDTGTPCHCNHVNAMNGLKRFRARVVDIQHYEVQRHYVLAPLDNALNGEIRHDALLYDFWEGHTRMFCDAYGHITFASVGVTQYAGYLSIEQRAPLPRIKPRKRPVDTTVTHKRKRHK